MSALTEREHIADYSHNGLGSRGLTENTRIDRPIAVQAVATLHKHGALDLMAPLGLWAYFKEENL